MKKILVVITTEFVPYGGLTSVMMNLYRKIDKKKFCIDFASTNKNINDALKSELKNNNSEYYYLGNRKKNVFLYCYKLNKILKQKKYDVIHVNSNSATALIELAISWWNGVPKRLVHNHTSLCDYKLFHWMMFPFFCCSYTTAIACSFKAGNWIFRNRDYMIINNGVDIERYKFSPRYRSIVRSKYNIHEETFVIGHVGKIYKPKNHHFLLRIFSEYHCKNKNSLLLLVGDGILRNEIEIEVRKLNLMDSVIFSGMQNNPEIFLSAMDLFAFPSIWEGMPLSLIEAQVNGLPCFISNTIDESAKISDNVTRLPIDCGVGCWVEAFFNVKLQDRNISSNKNIIRIKLSGFDAEKNAKLLENIYLQ